MFAGIGCGCSELFWIETKTSWIQTNKHHSGNTSYLPPDTPPPSCLFGSSSYIIHTDAIIFAQNSICVMHRLCDAYASSDKQAGETGHLLLLLLVPRCARHQIKTCQGIDTLPPRGGKATRPGLAPVNRFLCCTASPHLVKNHCRNWEATMGTDCCGWLERKVWLGGSSGSCNSSSLVGYEKVRANSARKETCDCCPLKRPDGWE